MGLAGLNPINEMYHSEEKEEMDENMYEQEDETALADEDEMPPMADEEPAEMGPEEEPEMEGGAADVEMDEQDLADVADALSVLQDKLAPLLDQAKPGEEEADMDMDAEEEPEMDDELADVDVEPSPEEEEEMQERIVNEVARRVAKRIVEAKRAHKKMNEALGRKK